MCDPITLGIGLLGALSAGATAISASSAASAPTPTVPALAPAPAATDVPDVKLGTEDDPTKDTSYKKSRYTTERRAQGFSLGDLGRGGLAI